MEISFALITYLDVSSGKAMNRLGLSTSALLSRYGQVSSYAADGRSLSLGDPFSVADTSIHVHVFWAHKTDDWWDDAWSRPSHWNEDKGTDISFHLVKRTLSNALCCCWYKFLQMYHRQKLCWKKENRHVMSIWPIKRMTIAFTWLLIPRIKLYYNMYCPQW